MAISNEPLYVSKNVDGIQSEVYHIRTGYSVHLRDTDADELCGFSITYKSFDDAITEANRIVAA